MSTLVLIVDDSNEDREAARLNLSEAAEADGTDFRFIESSSGEAGLLAYHSDAPDCILLDHRLPDMDGLEFMERIREGAATLPVPVVVVTGFAGFSLGSHALGAGAQEYLPKHSMKPEMLYRAVQSARSRFDLHENSATSEIREELALSRAETLDGVADLLASTLALASSQEEISDGLTKLGAATAALSASRTETRDGLANLAASATELSESRAKTRDGRAELLASKVVNQALSLANAALVASDKAFRKSQARLHDSLSSRQVELERLVAERTTGLVKAEARFRGIFDSQVQFISLLAPDGAVIEMNRTALDAVTLERGEIIGLGFWDLGWWSLEQRPLVREDVAAAAAGGLVRREVEIRLQREDAERMWIDLSLTPVRDPGTGAVVWLIAEGHNLTEKRSLAAQLAQAQKMQALGQLAGGLAHDFNNILQVVLGATSLIEDRPDDLERTRRLARAAITASDRGMSITQRLLSFGRRAELHTETIATTELVSGMCEIMRHTVGAAITVRTDVQSGVRALTADRAQLDTALINLCNNARDAMPEGGTLILSARSEYIGMGARNAAGLAAGNYVRLAVSDDGMGMDAATLARVSEPFFTTKPRGKGTGLGVAMAKGFAEQSGGGLSIESMPGVGTTVALWLQATDIIPLSPGTGTLAHEALYPSALVLLVDDDDQVREVLAAQLEAKGFRTLTASSGQEAIALLQVGELVDIIVTDFSMPGMNGVTVIEQARALRPTLPCFLLTGYVGDVAVVSVEENRILRKPITGVALAAEIETALMLSRASITAPSA